MKSELQKTGSVWHYDETGNNKVQTLVQDGQRITWKRNGQRGTVNAVVVGFSDSNPDKVFVENWAYDWSAPYYERARVWIKKRNVSRLIRIL